MDRTGLHIMVFVCMMASIQSCQNTNETLGIAKNSNLVFEIESEEASDEF